MSLCEEVTICIDGKDCRRTLKSHPFMTCACATTSMTTALVLTIYACTAGKVYLDRDQQAILHQRHELKRVVNGPGYVRFDPFKVRAEVRNAILLTELTFVNVKDSVLGTKKTVAGPGLYFPGMFCVSAPVGNVRLAGAIRKAYM
jgi:hypothetical protein